MCQILLPLKDDVPDINNVDNLLAFFTLFEFFWFLPPPGYDTLLNPINMHFKNFIDSSN